MAPSTHNASNPSPLDSTISPARFADALTTLPLDALYAKAAELRNSILHLRHSNEQMLPFADQGDADCREAMFENLGVIGRMNERLGLVRREVEERGMVWHEEADDLRDGRRGGDRGANGAADRIGADVTTNGSGNAGGGGERAAPRAESGRLTDEELRRRVEAQMYEDEAGVHL